MEVGRRGEGGLVRSEARMEVSWYDCSIEENDADTEILLPDAWKCLMGVRMVLKRDEMG